MNSLSSMITRNWTLKVSALGIAVLLWFSVRVEAPGRQTITVPVRVDLSDPEWVMESDPEPASVEVRFGGEAGDLARVLSERPTILIPVDEVRGGDTTIVLRNQWVRVQDRPGLRIEDIQPPMVSLSFEPVDRTSLPVAWRLDGVLPDSLALRSWPRATPPDVRVIGPRSLVSTRDSIRLEALDLSAVQGSGVRAVGVDSTRVQGLQVQPLSVDLDIQVEAREERDLEGVPVLTDDDLEDEFEDIPDTWTVRLSGAASRIRTVQPGLLRIFLELDEDDWPAAGEDVVVPLRLEGLPELVRGVLEPPEVRIRRVDPEGTAAEPGLPGLPSGGGLPGGWEGGTPVTPGDQW